MEWKRNTLVSLMYSCRAQERGPTSHQTWAKQTKNLPAVRESPFWFLGQEDLLEKKKWQPTPVSLPEKSHGQRSLVDYSPWGRKESDMAERANLGESSCCPSSLWQPWKISSLDLKISNPKTKAQYEKVVLFFNQSGTNWVWVSVSGRLPPGIY